MVIVAGYLGAGKTSLLNHLLRNSGGTRIGVVVNDFGSINIDSMLVAGQVDSMVSLGNGCMCCAVDVSDMDAMFDKLAHPRSNIDVIVVEASGLAEPRSLIRLVLGSENPRIEYGGLVEVVDAVEFGATRERHPELDTHLRLSDLVVLNKADRVAGEELSEVTETLRDVVGQVPVLATTHGQVDADLLFDAPDRDRRSAGPEQLTLDALLDDDNHDHEGGGHSHLHDEYDSISFTSSRPLDPRALLGFLEDPPDGLFRAKGIIAFAVEGERRKFVMHTVGRYIRFDARSWGRGEPPETQLVVIGTGLDADAISVRLQSAVHGAEELLAPDAMLPMYRYLPDSAAS